MHWFSIAVALLAAFGIIVIGGLYLFSPRSATLSFGLPLPGEGANIAWWLRLKGVRDVASGLVVLALMVWGGPQTVGIALLVEAMIPLGDMSLILAAKGSTGRAFGIHGVTAALMVLAAVPLLAGVA
ncbi:DUF4267 domain-containing protein [Nitrospirillum viridazoti]|uniref:DUF4267 domain-containing protein n=1 Tax=Nitrospirillum viridazoti CBAmc TaxID=1441467 RepID=A0A248K207_9PROT|nr:DUF4267 domain-containing protein [Nitrospirillum amazonense]ASG24870.1 hypothetical protein Y958_27075 [Nitrospirillum amazonense CBAmc]TWB37116.1 uncharacterized protein DUF4267 [Nitrospirillum amazonense]